MGVALIIVCTLLWSTDVLFRTEALGILDPQLIVFFEHLLCVALTLPAAIGFWRETKTFTRSDWLAAFFIGAVGSCLGTLAFTSAYRSTHPTIVILLQKLQPVFAVLSARLILKEVPARNFYGWAFVALLASISLIAPQLTGLDYFSIKGALLAVCAALFWGLSTTFGKVVTKKASFKLVSALRFQFGLLAAALVVLETAYFTNSGMDSFKIQTFFAFNSLETIRQLIYIAVFPGVLAMYLYYAGLQRTRASVASIAELAFPMTSIVVNWVVLKQPLSVTQLVASGVLIFAVFQTTRTSPQRL